MKILAWLDRMFTSIGMVVAGYYLRNFCSYK